MPSKGNKVGQRRRKVQSFISNCKEYTIRGTAIQIARKYIELALEVVGTERQYLLQHAEHWQRQAQEI